MKVCVPAEGKTPDSRIGEHFGKVPYYLIFDLDSGEMKALSNMGDHENLYPPEIIKHEGADVLLCAGIGRRALKMFEDFGIKVYTCARGTAKDAVQMFKKGVLKEAEEKDACVGHG